MCENQQIIIATKTESDYVSETIIKGSKSDLEKVTVFPKLEEYLKTLFSDIIRIPVSEINNHVNLGDYGLDSLVTLEATERIKKVFNQFSNTVLFEFATVDRLMQYLIEHHSPLVVQHFSTEGHLKEMHSMEMQSMNEITSLPISSVNNNDIAVIGFNGRFPGAENTDEFWDLLLNQKSAISETPRDRQFGSSLEYMGGFLKNVADFDALAFNISPREAEKMDPQERLFLENCWELLERSGYTKAYLSACEFNVGTFVGATNTDYSLYTFTDNQRTQHNYAALWSIANRVSYFFNLAGPSLTIDTACASSLTAIHMACQSIRQGECQLAIAGGVNLITSQPLRYAC